MNDDQLRSEPIAQGTCSGPFVSTVSGNIPERGQVSLSGVDLPPGGPALGGRVWISDEVLRGPADLWAAFATQFSSTGLWPTIVYGQFDANLVERGYSNERSDAEEVLTESWQRFVAILRDSSEFMGDRSVVFPGLTANQDHCVHNALEVIGRRPSSGRFALVPVARPADVVDLLVWNGTNEWLESSDDVSTILRSWEDRMGAFVFGLGFDKLSLVVERPPLLGGDDRIRWQYERTAFNPTTSLNFETFEAPLQYGVEEVLSFWWD